MQNRQPFAEPAVRPFVTYLNANARWCCVRAPCHCARGLPSNALFHDRGDRYRDDARPGGDDGQPPHDGLQRYDGVRSKHAVSRPFLSS